jgi:hypothetical protein
MLALILLGAVLLALIAVILFPWVAGTQLADYCSQEGNYRYDRARISALYPHLRTGDILLFAARASLIPIATQSQFTHAAMVVRRPSARCGRECRASHLRDAPGAPAPRARPDCIDCEVLIAEVSGGVGDGKLAEGFVLPAGVVISPLLARLKYYPGTAFVMRLEGESDQYGVPRRGLSSRAADAIERALAERLGRPFDPPASILLSTLLGQPAFHCYGLVSQLIDAALRSEGAPPLSSASVLGVVPAVVGLQGVPLVDAEGARYRYRPIVEVLYDIDSE